MLRDKLDPLDFQVAIKRAVKKYCKQHGIKPGVRTTTCPQPIHVSSSTAALQSNARRKQPVQQHAQWHWPHQAITHSPLPSCVPRAQNFKIVEDAFRLRLTYPLNSSLQHIIPETLKKALRDWAMECTFDKFTNEVLDSLRHHAFKKLVKDMYDRVKTRKVRGFQRGSNSIAVDLTL